jgi:hypothetical protein
MINYGFTYINGRLVMRFESRGMERFVTSPYEVREREWDAEAGGLVLSAAAGGARRRKLMNYQRAMARDLRLAGSITGGMASSSSSVDDIANAYHEAIASRQLLSVYATLLAEELSRHGCHRTSRGYLGTVRRLIDFNRGHDIRLDEISARTISAFQSFLIDEEELTPPTISFYMRGLRAIYNKAVAEGVISPSLEDPFEDAYVAVEF